MQHSSASSSTDSAVVSKSSLPFMVFWVFMPKIFTTLIFDRVSDGEKEFH